MVHIAYMDWRGEACRSHLSRCLWKTFLEPTRGVWCKSANQTRFFVSGSSLRSRRRWILSMWALLAFSKSVTCLQQHKHHSSIIANHSSMITHPQRSASSRDFSISPSFQTYQDKSSLKRRAETYRSESESKDCNREFPLQMLWAKNWTSKRDKIYILRFWFYVSYWIGLLYLKSRCIGAILRQSSEACHHRLQLELEWQKKSCPVLGAHGLTMSKHTCDMVHELY